MIIQYSNLDDSKKIFLNRELADILYLCRKRKISVPEFDINVVSLSEYNQIPEHLQSKISIKIPSKNKHFSSFNQMCEYENDIQTSQVIRDENIIWIIGAGSEGALYGFYETIRKITGIRWYGTSEFDMAFAKPNSAIEGIYRPRVPLRGFEFSPKNENHEFSEKFLKWMVRNRWNLLDINVSHWEKYAHKQEFIRLCNTFGIRLAIGCHAVDFFVPEFIYNKTPHMFGVRDGNRCITSTVGSPDIKKRWQTKIQPCYTNSETRELYVNAVVDFINNHPETYIFSLWPHDGINNWCQCQNCKEQSPYEMMYRIALEILEKLGRFIPIELLCYSNMFHLPEKNLPVSSNTYTIFCPYLRQYKHKFFEPGFNQKDVTLGAKYPDEEPINPVDDREYGILLSQWLPYLKKIGSVLGIFSYYQLVFHDQTERSDRSRYLYQPEPALVEDEINWFIKSGMKVFYDCSPPYPGFWPDGRFYAYLPRLLWENSPNADRFVMEYYKAIAGERAEVLKNILKTISGFINNNESDEIPSSDIVNIAKGIFNSLNSPLKQKYKLWFDYVLLGKQSWKALKQKNIGDMIEAEKKIIAFFQDNRSVLEDFINVDYMIKHSQAIIDFYTSQENL
ncbi:MAG TPA: DUF4838 domain-containing protein [bacterium]|nr:DUF4838 domain-containing protein [bacterium]